MSRMLVAVLGILAAVCLVLVQFFAWGGVSSEGGEMFGFSFPGSSVDAHTWKMEANFGDQTEKESWYSGEFDDAEDEDDDFRTYLMEIRIAIPLLMAGLVLAGVAAILAFMSRGPSAVLLLLAGIATTIGTILFAVAVDGMFDSDQDWGASFYLGIVASALALIGGVVGLAGGRGSSN